MPGLLEAAVEVALVSVDVVSWFKVVSSMTAVSALTIEAVVVQKTRPKAMASDGRIAPLEYWSSFFIALINVKSFRTETLLYPYWLTTSIIFCCFFDWQEPSGQRESNPHGQLGRLELYH